MTRTNIIEVRGITFGYGEWEVLKGVSLSLERGEMLGVIGPNGSGKSTLLKVISGLLRPWTGEVLVKGRPSAFYGRRETARIIASVSQESAVDFPFTVRETVAMGRTPYVGRFAVEGKRDREVIEEVMELTDITPFADRLPGSLSGGERQRVMIARALAQEPEILLMDEPTSHLDLRHQVEINSLVMRMMKERGLGVIYVTHDLNTASACCDRIVMLHDGRLHAAGNAFEVLTRNNIETVYGCPVLVDENPATGRPRITPLAVNNAAGKP